MGRHYVNIRNNLEISADTTVLYFEFLNVNKLSIYEYDSVVQYTFKALYLHYKTWYFACTCSCEINMLPYAYTVSNKFNQN